MCGSGSSKLLNTDTIRIPIPNTGLTTVAIHLSLNADWVPMEKMRVRQIQKGPYRSGRGRMWCCRNDLEETHRIYELTINQSYRSWSFFGGSSVFRFLKALQLQNRLNNFFVISLKSFI